jgi:N-acetylglucosaminyl-diphospho-decaprenol L-rhamnosyltransferase
VIAAVVVTYSAPAEMLDRCVRALLAEGGLDRVVVVDTGGAATISDDISDDISDGVSAAVTVITMPNRGYGAAANRGFAESDDASCLILLNDDVVVQPGWLAPLVTALADDRVGAAQPMLVGADHEVVTSLGVELDRYGAGSDVGDGEPVPVDRAMRPVELFNAGTVAFDPAFLAATGGFDERLFLYYEDVDLARRGRALGWEYRLVPTSVVEHRRGTSSSERADLTLFHQERNRLWTAARFGSAATFARALSLSIRRLRHPPSGVHRRALVAGLAGVPQRLIERLRRRHQVSRTQRTRFAPFATSYDRRP